MRASFTFLTGIAACLGLATAAQAKDSTGNSAAPDTQSEAHHASGHGADRFHAGLHAIFAAVGNPNRGKDALRDKYRHPVQTMAFFGLEPDMKIGEYAPGGGWYSRLLADFLGEKASLTGLFRSPSMGPFSAAQKAKIRADAEQFPALMARFSGKRKSQFNGFTLDAIPAGEEGTFDRVLLIRMMHNLMRWNMADSELKAMRSLLKPDGLLGIVQHRARPQAPFAYADGNKGYLRQADVFHFVEANGFELVGMSEINANPKDSADHPRGVWEMPPVLATKSEALKRLGESDRMTLLFRKRK